MIDTDIYHSQENSQENQEGTENLNIIINKFTLMDIYKNCTQQLQVGHIVFSRALTTFKKY